MKMATKLRDDRGESAVGKSGRTGQSKEDLGITPGHPSEPVVSKILVIDDDHGLQRLIQRTLESGAQVFQEFDGQFELDLGEFDLVILDYQMPGADGLRLLRRIRGDYPELPVLFMTGFGDLRVARAALDLGANEYLPKPFQPVDLRAAVSRWVDHFDAVPGRPADRFTSLGAKEISRESENFLTAFDREGAEIITRVVRFNSRTVVVEAGLDSQLLPGEELTKTCITLGNRSMEIAQVFVVSVSPISDRLLVEIRLPGIWKIEGYDAGIPPMAITQMARESENSDVQEFRRLNQGLTDRKKIPSAYRVTVDDLESIMQEIYDDLEPFRSSISGAGTSERLAFEEKLIEQAKNRFFPAVTEAMDRFEWAAELAAKDGIKKEFKNFSQRALYPFLLCSPFMSRVIRKPIGVPGDYGILGQILGNPFDGHTLFGRMLNGWVLSSCPARAYRHRVDLLRKMIEESAKWAEASDEVASVLSMASGVAFEVQQFISHCRGTERVEFDLVDFSETTLEEAKRQHRECRKASDPREVRVNFSRSSVVDLAKQTRGANLSALGAEAPHPESYHLVYCAGLFDYLSDRLCRSVVDYLYTLVRPGGSLVVSNYTPLNSLKNFMDVVLDWDLIYRGPDDLSRLVSRTKAKDCFSLETDQTGAEAYAMIKKPG